LWTADFKEEKAVDLEYRYVEDTMPCGVLAPNAAMHENLGKFF
jgi:hypothetical protein